LGFGDIVDAAIRLKYRAMTLRKSISIIVSARKGRGLSYYSKHEVEVIMAVI
jgi:hypothetical protein